MCVCVCVCVRMLGSNRLHPNCSAGDRLELFLSLRSNGSRLKSLVHIAGWEFVLQRCARIVGMDIDLEGDAEDVSRAEELMKGFTMQATSGAQHRSSKAFASLKELRISWRFLTNCDAQHASHMALVNMALVCHSLEVRTRRSNFCIPAHWQSSVQAIIA